MHDTWHRIVTFSTVIERLKTHFIDFDMIKWTTCYLYYEM